MRAHLVLTAMSHAYVWCEGEDGAAKVFAKSKSYNRLGYYVRF